MRSTLAYRLVELVGPVELVVIGVTHALEDLLEHVVAVLVVGRLEEVQPTCVAQVLCEFLCKMISLIQTCFVAIQTWESLAEHLDRRGTLGVADLLITLLERVGLEALPGQ